MVRLAFVMWKRYQSPAFLIYFLESVAMKKLRCVKFTNSYDEKKVKLATVIDGDPKAPFLIATTPRYRGGHYSYPWIAPLYPWHVPYNADC